MPLCLLVSSLPEARCEPPACDAAEEEEVQEQNHPGLQDPGSGSDQHGRGTTGSTVLATPVLQTFMFPSGWNAVTLLTLCFNLAPSSGHHVHVLYNLQD